MAKGYEKRDGKATRLSAPSPFGSHTAMVVRSLDDEGETTGRVVCKDEVGEYITYKGKLDTGLADVNRYSGRERPDPLPDTPVQ